MWPGVWIGSISQRAGRDRLAGRHRAGGAARPASRSSWWISTGVARIAAEHRVELGDVIVVVVGEQHVRQLELAPGAALEQRRHRAAGVDHHRVAAELVGDQVGVRQVPVAHRALDQIIDHLQGSAERASGSLRT